MVRLDKMESRQSRLDGMEGEFVCLREEPTTSRIKKTDCWEIVKVCTELNRIYLKKVGRKVVTEKTLSEIEDSCIVIFKKELNMM